MKLTILVPSESYKSSAGARIRYRRLAPWLERIGIELTLEQVGGFDAVNADGDILLVSKCYDARALVAAAEISNRGKLVGVDLFDDYFSPSGDSRLLRHKNWLAQIVPSCDFAVCSTGRMATAAERSDRDLPVHVLNDPAPQADLGAIGAEVAKKFAMAQSDGVLRIGWFGVGDNPYFPVGLADLSAYAAVLVELTRSGMPVDLTILTNARALSADGLSLIERLPVRKTVREWSENAERQLLGQALAIFLPVSTQPFSVAKSLNRAVTAMSSGCQVLTAGYPLYAPLEPLIYANAAELVDDIDRGSLRLSSSSIGQYMEIVHRLASPDQEAARLARFLFDLELRPRERSLPLALIHGHSAHPDAHRLVQDAKGFSVASPFCSARLDFDVIFRGTGSELRMLVSRTTARRLLPRVRSRLRRTPDSGGKGYFELPQVEGALSPKRPEMAGWQDAPVAFQLATYESAMDQVSRRMAEAFGNCRTLFSERSPLPFPVVAA